MNNINYLATELRVAALDTSEMVIREFHRGNYWYFILIRNGKQVGGVEFSPSDDPEGWWLLNSLFSDSISGTMILLFSALSKVKKIIPSRHISPAAAAVVAGIYKRYKNTEVVEPDIQESWLGREAPDYLRAGYVWSSELRQIPIKFENITDVQEQKEHYHTYSKGFDDAYSSDTKKKKYDLNFLLKTQDWQSLTYGLEKALSGYITRYSVLPWLKKNEAQLKQFGLLDAAVEFIKEKAAEKNINLQKLEIDSFDPNHEYYGGKVQYET